MLTQYLIASILIAFLLTCDIFILVHPHLSLKKYPIFFFSFSALFYIQIYFTFYPMLFVILVVNSILLVIFTKKLYFVFYIPLGYIFNCVLGNLMGLTANIIWDLSVKELNADILYLTIYGISTLAASCLILYLVRRFFQKYLIDTFEKMSKKLLSLIALTLLLCAFMVFTMASFFDNIDITHREYFLMASSLVLYFLFTISMIFIVLHTTRKSYEAQKKMEYLENLNEYTRNLEMVYDNLRSFKHDYINIMASLAAYIDEKKYDELGTFFYEYILPMQKNLTQKNGTLNNLLRVRILELKSILYTKLLLAVNQNIQVNLDIPDEIDSIHMEPIDMTRMLGIYLDNAIEACLEAEHPVINFHLGKMNQDIVFIISNTFIDKGLSVAQMHKKGVTTKGDGHGLGLYNVSEILNRYDNIYHEALIKDSLFIQQVQIS
ncbi:GHKL domain-containing protein [Lachnospiraceae bacterium WCA-9-b2]|uniref:GHKL domain-containing protein n=3 Tax=Sporofaciens musculi TaxID=2681861 RepID=A0A7X3SJJ8_9FIRM|nr:GHKL domain-containing protein [Sporofaciens musculi]